MGWSSGAWLFDSLFPSRVVGWCRSRNFECLEGDREVRMCDGVTMGNGAVEIWIRAVFKGSMII